MKVETIDILLNRLENELAEKQKAKVQPHQLQDIVNNITILKKNRAHWQNLPPVDVNAIILVMNISIVGGRLDYSPQSARCDVLVAFTSQVLPLSGENAWLQTGLLGSVLSQINTTIISFPLYLSLQ